MFVCTITGNWYKIFRDTPIKLFEANIDLFCVLCLQAVYDIKMWSISICDRFDSECQKQIYGNISKKPKIQYSRTFFYAPLQCERPLIRTPPRRSKKTNHALLVSQSYQVRNTVNLINNILHGKEFLSFL